MDTPISNLYRQLLKRFNFSIGGYSNPEKEVSDFFLRLCKNELIYQNHSIRLLMFGFAQLTANDINEIDLDKWETKPLKRFNYFDYSSGYSEVLLSLYLHCLNEICENKRATNIISGNFRKNINLRVILDKTRESFLFRENNRIEALEIVVPGNIFNYNDIPFNINSFKDKNDNVETEIKNFVIQDDEFEHEYKIDVNTQLQFKHCYTELAKKIFKIQPKDFKSNISKHLPSKMIQDKIKLKTLHNPDANLEDILAIAYSASLFCYFFDCTFEYFISVSNGSLDKKYSLGSIAVGVKNNEDLSFDERAIFSIISNHIASNLSAQIIFENNEAIKLRYSRENFKKLFDKFAKVLDCDSKDRSHSNDSIDDGMLKLWKQQAEEYTELIKPFISNENKYAPFLINGHKTHQGLLLNVYLDKQKEAYLRSKSLFYNSIVMDGFSGYKYDYIDFIFVEEFLSLLNENKAGKEGNRISIQCKFDGNRQLGIKNKRFEIEVEFLGSDSQFRMSDFYLKLKAAHHSTGTNFTSFILNNYNLIRIHGDLEIMDKEGTSHFLLSRDTKLNSKDSNNPFLEISKESIPLEPFGILKFIIHIQHEL